MDTSSFVSGSARVSTVGAAGFFAGLNRASAASMGFAGLRGVVAKRLSSVACCIRCECNLSIQFAKRPDAGQKRPRLFLVALDLLDKRLQTVELQFVAQRSEEHTSELQSLMRNSYAVFCLKKKKQQHSCQKTHSLHVTLICTLTS